MRTIRTKLTRTTLGLALILGATTAPAANDGTALAERPHLRRPIDLALLDGRAYVANERSGSVSVVDPAAGKALAEHRVGESLSAIEASGEALLATDREAGELIRLRPTASAGLRVTDRLDVGSSPVGLAVNRSGGTNGGARDGKACWIANLWSHRVRRIALGRDGPMRVTHTIDLPFAPRRLWLSPDGRWLVAADAFAGRLALIDRASPRLATVRSLEGHNIAGLLTADGGDALRIAHQTLNPRVPTIRSRVSWGNVINNVVRTVELDHLRNTVGRADPRGPRPIERWTMNTLGRREHGAADPGPMARLPDGGLAVALRGVARIAVRTEPLAAMQRIRVGEGPSAIVRNPRTGRLLVANRFDDTLSIVDPGPDPATANPEPSREPPRLTATVPLGPRPEPTPADRGEALFHDARLSLGRWYSCASCHVGGHTIGRLNDNLSDGSTGTPKRVLALGGVGETAPWAWNGSNETLAEQVHGSVTKTMRGEDPTEPQTRALVAYLRTLDPPPALPEARGTVDREKIRRGRRVFERRDCADCHTPPTYTDANRYGVGLRDEAGATRFNPPSLRGLSQRERFFHDNRAASLRAVFTEHHHPDGADAPPLTDAELDALLAFLRSL